MSKKNFNIVEIYSDSSKLCLLFQSDFRWLLILHGMQILQIFYLKFQFWQLWLFPRDYGLSLLFEFYHHDTVSEKLLRFKFSLQLEIYECNNSFTIKNNFHHRQHGNELSHLTASQLLQMHFHAFPSIQSIFALDDFPHQLSHLTYTGYGVQHCSNVLYRTRWIYKQ